MGSTDEFTKNNNLTKESPLKDKESNAKETSRKVTPSVDIVGANARISSGGDSPGNSPTSPSERQKRQRTLSENSPVQNFLFPPSASPPKFMSLEEVMKATKGVSNMVLAHEIAVDKNFRLEKFDPPENSLQKRVRDIMHKAFWDNLQEELAREPPCYDQAFVLLQEVKDKLLEITLPQHTKLRQEINDKFDVELIRQQAEHQVLNFAEYSQYVLHIMARLCAPVRDIVIQKLTQKKDVVEVFRGVLETMDLMRLDMANYTIQQIRPYIVAQSVEYEKMKFSEFLKTQDDGLEITRRWLTEQFEEVDLDENTEDKNITDIIISKAYLKLLDWPDDVLLPETVVLDGSRFLELKDRLIQVCIMGTILLVTLSSLNTVIPNTASMKLRMKKNICSILDPAFSEKETYELMPNLAEQVIKDVNDYLTENNLPQLRAPVKNALKSQLVEIKNPEQKIRQLITNRSREFIGNLLRSTTARPVQLPPGLTALQEELAHVSGTLLRIVSHNRAVFGDYYADIINQHIKTASK